MKVILASKNQHKLTELSAILSQLGFEIALESEYGLDIDVEETGTTFEENSFLKADAVMKASGLPVLADDSGLMVDALDGAPGVYTADWAERQWFEGEPGKDWAGRDWYMAMGKVEGLLAEQGPGVDRSACFVCTLALAWPDGHAEIFEGRAGGSLTWPPRGTLGFGYDPVFVPTGKSLTYAEIDPAEKHAISHRADAFAKLVAGVF